MDDGYMHKETIKNMLDVIKSVNNIMFINSKKILNINRINFT